MVFYGGSRGNRRWINSLEPSENSGAGGSEWGLLPFHGGSQRASGSSVQHLQRACGSWPLRCSGTRRRYAGSGQPGPIETYSEAMTGQFGPIRANPSLFAPIGADGSQFPERGFRRNPLIWVKIPRFCLRLSRSEEHTSEL